MATALLNNKRTLKTGAQRDNPGERGATMIEVVISMLVMMIGVFGLIAAMAWGVSLSGRARNMSNTKLTISAMLEQIETLRNTRQLTFGQIANVGSVNNIGSRNPSFAGFPTGFQPVSRFPGPDGVYGTSDDFINPGPDNDYTTTNDNFVDMTRAVRGYTREIVVTALSTSMKEVRVTMTFPGRSGTHTLVGTSYLNDHTTGQFR